jgi:hypothetical protein
MEDVGQAFSFQGASVISAVEQAFQPASYLTWLMSGWKACSTELNAYDVRVTNVFLC